MSSDGNYLDEMREKIDSTLVEVSWDEELLAKLDSRVAAQKHLGPADSREGSHNQGSHGNRYDSDGNKKKAGKDKPKAKSQESRPELPDGWSYDIPAIEPLDLVRAVYGPKHTVYGKGTKGGVPKEIYDITGDGPTASFLSGNSSGTMKPELTFSGNKPPANILDKAKEDFGIESKMKKVYTLGANEDSKEPKGSSTWRKGLTKPEKDALSNYSGRTYAPINSALRENRDLDDAELEEDLDALDAALKKSALKEPITVYRQLTAPKIEKAFKDGELVGGDIKDPAFVSASLTKKALEEYKPAPSKEMPIVAEIKLPEGTNAGYLGDLADNPDELELLIARDQTYRVIAADEIDGELHIALEVVQDD